MKRLQLIPQAQWTRVHGGPVILDLVTGNWAALTPEAEEFLLGLQAGTHDAKYLSAEQQELVNVLMQLRLVADEEVGAYEDLRFASTVENRLFPQAAYVHVTFACNLTCPACYSFDERRNRCADLDNQNMRTIFRKLREGGIEEVIISGGEPFARQDMIDLLHYCKMELGYSRIVVITNGTLLEEELVSKLETMVDQIAVSIDGYNEETNAPIRGRGNFGKAIRGLEHLRAHQIPCHIITTLHQRNVRDVRRFLEFADQLGVHMNFSIFASSGLGAVNSEILQISLDALVLLGIVLAEHPGKASVLESPCSEGLRVRDRCGIGTHLISVQADGTVYPCHITMAPHLVMGNLLDQDLMEILLASPVAQLCRELGVETVGQCSGCEYKFFCGGGCRGNALYTRNDIKASDPHCIMNKTFLKIAVETVIGPNPT